MRRVLFALVCLIFGVQTANAIHVTSLHCELQANPLALNQPSPRLGWVLQSDLQGDRQTAFEIMAASAEEKLQAGRADLWQTGKVESDQSQYVAYAGKQLPSMARVYWKVRVWDAKGKPSAWSSTARFDIGILEPSDWGAQWIGAIRKEEARLPEGRNHHKWGIPKSQRALWDSVAPLARRSIMLRKEFGAHKNVARAMVYVAGLGHYELTLNGTKIGQSEFAPLWSDCDKTVYYNAYDITSSVLHGPNAIGVLLGNGMYNVTGNRYIKFWGSFGPPTLKLKMVVEYADGTVQHIVSDTSWKYAPSPITFNCIFGGEDYDATLEQPNWNRPGFDQQSWDEAVPMEGPKGRLVAQTAPPVQVMARYNVKKVVNALPGRILLDMGQNLSGFPSIRVRGQKGQVVKLWVSELTKGDTTVNQSQTGSPHYYQYTLKGSGEETWQPRFSYYGYRYVQVEGVNYKGCPEKQGLPQLLDVKSCFVHSSAPRHGTFQSSNELFNQVHTLINNAIRSNMHAVFTDCPHREKLGWLEQTHLVGPGIVYNYDVANLYQKVQQDMLDAQLDNGLVPDIAPEYTVFPNGFRDSPEWGSSVAINPWMIYEYYGDASLIAPSYPAMKRYFGYLVSMADNGILSHGLGDWYDFGEHRAGPAKNTPIPLTATAYFYHMATLLEQTAAFVGNEPDQRFFAQWRKTIYEAFNKKFFAPDTQQYGTGSQVSNAMALYFGLVDEPHRPMVLEHIVADIRARGNRLTSGDIGNLYLFRVLAENGRNDVMFDMNNHYEVPGYGFQIQFGATTLTENWDPRQGASWNHFMMGQIEEWFFRHLAGIANDKANPGFKHFVVQPAFVGDTKWVSASTRTPYGDIETKWKKQDSNVAVSVVVPVNTSATVVLGHFDLASAKINGISLVKAKGVQVLTEGNKMRVVLGSGAYTLEMILR